MPHGLKGRAPGPPAAGPPLNFGRHFGWAVCYRYGPLDAGGSYAVARVHSQWGVDPLGVARVTEVLFRVRVRVQRRVIGTKFRDVPRLSPHAYLPIYSARAPASHESAMPT